MNEQKKINTVRKIETHKSEAFYLIVRGLEVGIVAGLIAVFYRYLLSFAENKLERVLQFVSHNPLRIAVWLVVLAVLGVFISLIVKLEPKAAGSGIPQINSEIKGRLSSNWWRVIIAKLVGGTVSVFAGLSLGREGPSVQLGGMAGKGVAKITKADKTTELRMISCGAGAGMAAAFNAPLAGIMFVLEEIHHSFDKNILCMGIVSTVTADYVSKLFFGQSTIFNYDTVNFPLKHYWILILLGIAIGLAGVGYTKIMLFLQDLYKKISIPNYIKLPFIFLVSGGVGLVLPQVLCGGHNMVEFLMNEHPGTGIMFGLLVAKFVFGAVCFASGAPGGTLYPLCILGTYLGAVLGGFAIDGLGLPEGLWEEFAVIGMAGFFSATIKSPITGVVLVFELTGNMNNLLPLVTVALISYATSNLLGSEPIYEALSARLASDKSSETRTGRAEKVIKSFVIPTGSDLNNKKIKDIDWGRHVLIVTVERGEESITPNGNVILHEGDELVFLVSQRRFARDEENLEYLFREQYKPKQ